MTTYISNSFFVLNMAKRQLAHLKKARPALVEHVKKQKLEETQLHNTKQPRIDK